MPERSASLVPTRFLRWIARRATIRNAAGRAVSTLELPTFTSYVSWHERYQHDPGHVWFRAALERAARSAYGDLLDDTRD